MVVAGTILVEVPVYYKVCDKGHVTIMEEASISRFKDEMRTKKPAIEKMERNSKYVKL
jgi:hypothetical protein